MALIPTPELKSNIENITKDFMNFVWSGQVPEDSFQTDPVTRTNIACAKFADDLSKAIEDWLVKVKFEIVIGSLQTVGSPMNHSNVNFGEIIKI
jgi:hypothetical protein